MLERILEKEGMMNPQEVKEYNLLSRRYLTRLGYDKVINSLYNSGRLEGKVIDLGTGSGWLAIELAKRNRDYQIVGVDLSQEMLTLAKQNVSTSLNNYSNLSFIKSDVKSLPFKDDSFDVAVSYASLHHWGGNLLEIFEEIQRVVKNDGLVIIHDLKRDEKNLLFLKTIPSKIMRKLLEASVMASYIPSEIREILRRDPITSQWQAIESTMGLGIEGRVKKRRI
ncbi:class I SAM-dependent methyltransferase [bacterium]|nr:class I SAM-dependent methyltransferase [bacterium]MBU1753925.1 class I SAM-dependent methyltransferase [bacterium]